VAYLGHLDLIRHLPRIFRRAGLELMYSSGFHPKPELTFGPALGLGVPSFGELLDVKLADAVDPAHLIRLLNGVTVDGIEFLAGVALGESDRGLGRVIARAEYAARLPDDATAERAVARFAEGAPLSVLRAAAPDAGRVSIGRTVDVRRSLLDVGRPDAGVAARLGAQLGWGPEAILSFSVSVSAEGSARPIEVIEALLDKDAAGAAEFARLGLAAAGGAGAVDWIDPLDLVALRALPLPSQGRGAVEPPIAAPPA
jgi:radical SAM-linked protein